MVIELIAPINSSMSPQGSWQNVDMGQELTDRATSRSQDQENNSAEGWLAASKVEHCPYLTKEEATHAAWHSALETGAFMAHFHSQGFLDADTSVLVPLGDCYC